MSVQAQAESQEIQYLRFARAQRIEHILLVVSFSMLALTGLIQKFNQVALAENIILLLGGIETVRLIHRTFALMMAIEGIYHIINLGYGLATKRMRPTMIPLPKDIVDAYQYVMYCLGWRNERPLFDRYDFRQKVEYWALVWGTIVMGLTGFTMWFPVQATQLVSGQVIPAAKAAHGAEAVLAVLAIFIWHFYGTHLNPDLFPLDKSIFNGHISEKRMLHEHPLEYARIKEHDQLAAAAAPVDQVAAAEAPIEKSENKNKT